MGVLLWCDFLSGSLGCVQTQAYQHCLCETLTLPCRERSPVSTPCHDLQRRLASPSSSVFISVSCHLSLVSFIFVLEASRDFVSPFFPWVQSLHIYSWLNAPFLWSTATPFETLHSYVHSVVSPFLSSAVLTHSSDKLGLHIAFSFFFSPRCSVEFILCWLDMF